MAVEIGKGSFKGFEQDKTDVTNFDKTKWNTDKLIGDNLQKISSNVLQMRKIVDDLGTPKDTRELRSRVRALDSSTNQLIKDTNFAIKEYSRKQPENANDMKGWKLQQKRFHELFHDALQNFQDVQATLRTKERDSIRRSLQQSGVYDIEVDERGSLTKDGQQIQICSIKASVDLNLIQEREQELRQLEQDIIDIRDIMKDLGQMVIEQGEVLVEIEGRVDKTAIHIESTTDDLRKAKQYVVSGRKKKVILFTVVLSAIAIIIIIIAVVVTKPKK